MRSFSRRDLIKMISVAGLGTVIPYDAYPSQPAGFLPEYLKNPLYRKPGTAVRAIVLGAGSRGNVYASYSSKFPDEIKIVGVAEPIDYRRNNFAQIYDIPEENQWITWEHAFQVPPFVYW